MIYILPTDTCYWIACPIHDVKSYNRIYKIKKRDLSKPLAIMVEDFNWLEKNTDLTTEQIQFLKEYKRPFTILTESDHLKLWMNYVNEDDNEEFPNRDIYEVFAFRVAHTDIQKKLIKQEWPIFLTSANLSNEWEIYTAKEILTQFEYQIVTDKIKFLWDNTEQLDQVWPSDIFSFIWESLEIEYMRKN